MSQGIAAQLLALKKIVQRDKTRKGRMVVVRPKQRKAEKKKIFADKLQLSGVVVRSETKELTFMAKGQSRTSLGGTWFMWLDKACIQGAIEHVRTMGREKCGAELGPDGQSIRVYSKSLSKDKKLEFERLIASLMESPRARRTDELAEDYRAAMEEERNKNATMALDHYMQTEFVELREGTVIRVGSFSGGTEAAMMASVQFAKATAYNVDGSLYLQPIKDDPENKTKVTDYLVRMSVNTNYVRMNAELSSIPFLLRLPVNPVCRSGGGIGVGALIDCKRHKKLGVARFGSILVGGWRDGLNPSDSTHAIRLIETYRPDDAAAQGYSDVSVWSRVTAIEDEWVHMRKLDPNDNKSVEVETMCARINLVYTEDLDLIGAVEGADPDTGVLDYNRSAVCYDLMLQLWDKSCAPLGMATSVHVWREMMQAHNIPAIVFGNVKTDDTISAITNSDILASNEPRRGPYWATGIGPAYGTLCVHTEGIQWGLAGYLMEFGVQVTEATARHEAFLRVITKDKLGGGAYLPGKEIEWPINVANTSGIASGDGWVGDVEEFLDGGLPSSTAAPPIPDKCPFSGKPPVIHPTRPRRSEVQYRVLVVPQVDKGRDKITKQMITVSEALPADTLRKLARLTPEEGSALFEEGGEYEQAQTVVYALRPSVCARMTLTDQEAGQFRGGGAGVRVLTKKHQDIIGEEEGGGSGSGGPVERGPVVEYAVVSPTPAGPVFSRTWEEAIRANNKCVGEDTDAAEGDEEGSDQFDSVLEDGGAGLMGRPTGVVRPAEPEVIVSGNPMHRGGGGGGDDGVADMDTTVEIPVPTSTDTGDEPPELVASTADIVEEIEEIEEIEAEDNDPTQETPDGRGRKRAPLQRTDGAGEGGEGETTEQPAQPKRRVFAQRGGKKGK